MILFYAGVLLSCFMLAFPCCDILLEYLEYLPFSWST